MTKLLTTSAIALLIGTSAFASPAEDRAAAMAALSGNIGHGTYAELADVDDFDEIAEYANYVDDDDAY